MNVERLNRVKIGAPHNYPECLKVFLAYLHVLLKIDYRGLEGFLGGLAKLVHFAVPDYATICRRVNRVSLEVKKTLIPFEGKEVVSHGITPATKIRENAGPTCRSKNPRKGYAREFRELGFERWREKYEYGKRWYSEGTFSAVKRKFGECVRAIKAKNIRGVVNCATQQKSSLNV